MFMQSTIVQALEKDMKSNLQDIVNAQEKSQSNGALQFNRKLQEIEKQLVVLDQSISDQKALQ